MMNFNFKNTFIIQAQAKIIITENNLETENVYLHSKTPIPSVIIYAALWLHDDWTLTV